MKYPVRLFLANEEVEFSTPPQILFNYSETELTNPTIVKNYYSKTITIEGTPKNNQIFGHIYDMQRIQGSNGSTTGSGFNPLVKTDFTLYYNSSIYESGYFKLDHVRRNDNNIEYDITLYGGLGDFFYSLSFNEDGTPMELSDLIYEYEDWSEQPLAITINKEAVAQAWSEVQAVSSKWATINFAPCYNGIPSTLSADKVLINTSGISDYTPTLNIKPYSMGVSSEELTEWEAFDLRSYLQRPVLRVEEVIKACQNTNNNGGYTVNLDEDFFNSNNPYYHDAWMTLPLLTELDVPATVESPLAVTAFTKESTYLYDVWSEMGTATNVSLDMQVRFTPESFTGTSIYLARAYWADGGITLQDRFCKTFNSDTFITLQLLGYNTSGQIAATSDMYYLTSYISDNWYYKNDEEFAKDAFNSQDPKTDVTKIRYIKGKFTKKNGVYVWTGEYGTTRNLHFEFPSSVGELDSIKLKVVICSRQYMKKTFNGGSMEYYHMYDTSFAWSEKITNSNTWQDADYVRTLDRVNGAISFVPLGATGTTTSYEGFYSNRTYSKKELLSLGVTPASLLLSYAKMFGLYFIKDTESKTVDILTRHNFYQRDNVVNINDLIDKGSDITITPNSPQYQYYDFTIEQAESEAGAAYKRTYGYDYGTASVNTNYQYEKEHKSVLDGNIFRGGINVLEKDKYFLKPRYGQTSTTSVHNGPTYVYNGFKYWYQLTPPNTDEFSFETQTMTGETINPDGLRYYDVFPKPQFHTEGNEASDGRLVLLFYSKDIDVSGIGYHLTDDTPEMFTLNDGKPCWMMNRVETDRSGNIVALTVNSLPMFTRDIYNDFNYISNSFDMGMPLTTYVPNKYVSDWQSIYSKGWKSYISDLYDVNTRVLKCRCLLRERPNPEWMRRFYWFDNSYWRLNEIKDWNISSFDTTEMTFIKVQDRANYDNVQFSKFPTVEWRLDKYSIGPSAETISGYIYVSDGTYVTATDSFRVEYSDGTVDYLDPTEIMTPTGGGGTTLIPVTINIPANPSALTRTIALNVEDSYDRFHEAEIRQSAPFNMSIVGDLQFGYSASSGTFNYTATETPIVSSYPDWVSGVTVNGTTAGTITVAVEENTGAQRSGSIVFSSEDGQQKGFPIVQTEEYSGLTLEILTGGTIGLRSLGGPSPKNYEVKINDSDWIAKSTGTLFTVSTGDKVSWKSTDSITFGKVFSGSCVCNVYGNISSLFDVNSTIQGSGVLKGIFGWITVHHAKDLVLPEAVSGSNIYVSSFRECTELVSPPTTIPYGNVGGMFSGCTSLPHIPTNLNGINVRMFAGCTSLTGVTIPSTLNGQPIQYLFDNCSNLERAELLPEGPYSATTGNYRFQYPFDNCSKLAYIKCMTQFNGQSFTALGRNLPSTGTLVTRTGLNWTNVPEGWTVIYE